MFPIYSLGYYPSDTSSLSLIEEIKGLRQDLRAALKGQGALANEPQHVSILRNACASCHSAPSPKGGFTLIEEDKLAKLSLEQWQRVFERVGDDSMPPGKAKLSKSDYAAIVSGVMKYQFSATKE